VLMFPDAQPRTLTVRLAAGAASVAGLVRPEVPPGWSCEPSSAPFALAAKGDELELAFHVRPAATAVTATEGVLHVIAEVGPARLGRGVVHVEHAHIPI